MKIFGKDKLTAFTEKHADARKWVEIWVAMVEGAQWKSTQDIKDRYPTASFLADRLVFFNVKGDHYRLKVQVTYNKQTVIVLWVGTHAEYSKKFKGEK